MPIPTTIDDLSTTAASNSPSGSDSATEGDNYLRALSAFIAQLRDQSSYLPTVINNGAVGGTANDSSAYTFENYHLWGSPSLDTKLKDVALTNNQCFDGRMARLTAYSGGTNLFTITGSATRLQSVYLSDMTALSGAAIRLGTGRSQGVHDIVGVNVGAGGIKLSPASPSTESCALASVSRVTLEQLTGFGIEIAPSVNDGQFSSVYIAGLIDYDGGGLGKPRAGSVGWYQNTTPDSSRAVGGHLVTSCTFISCQEGMHITDGQYSKYTNCIVDGCTGYGVIVDGASTDIEFHDLFVGTTSGVRISGSANVIIDGLHTTLTRVVPPWGQTSFYDIGGTVYDVTVQNTASLTIKNWRGDKRVYVDSTAELIVEGGQWIHFRTASTVAANSSTFMSVDGVTSTEQDATVRADRDGWLFVGRADSSAAPGSGKNFTFDVRLSGANALTVTISGTNTNATSYAYAVPVLKGQEIGVRLLTDAGAASAKMELALQILGD